MSEDKPLYDPEDLNKTYASFRDRSGRHVEPNISMREGMTWQDYNHGTVQNECNVKYIKNAIKDSNYSYYNVGIVKNIIDLMSDFAVQGLSIVHPDKEVEKFYKNWFKVVKGRDRTERFANYLLRTANVIVSRTTAKITKAKEAEYKKAVADFNENDIKIYKRDIPWSYEFINPLAVDIKIENGEKLFCLSLSNKAYNGGKIDGSNEFLPDYIKERILKGDKKIPLDMQKTSIYYYKKDDWAPWAIPMITPIIKDIKLLDKMKLADNAAIDGTMSQVRLWTIGNLEHKIPPNKAVIDTLRDVLSSGTGGGQLDLVWGPELSFTESNSQVYKFLGNEKYIPVLNNIYMGFGISSAIAGAGGNGGYTNNFVSIKTLIERLEYVREILTDFWNYEFEIVKKAMGFDFPAIIHFDSIIMSDEAAIKNLLINLVDRNIISEETLLERFREVPEVEKTRVARENKVRMDDPNAPQKTSPYHDPMRNEDLAHTALQNGNLAPEYFKRKNIPFREAPVEKTSKTGNTPGKKPSRTKSAQPAGGRPKNTRDTNGRKTRRVIPRARAEDTTKLLWAINAQASIANFVTPPFLEVAQKKNVRSLNKQEFDFLEEYKLKAFLNLTYGQELTEQNLSAAALKDSVISEEFYSIFNSKVEDFTAANGRMPNIEENRIICATIFAEYK